MLSPVKETPSDRELGCPGRTASAGGWCCVPGAGGASRPRTDPVKRPAAVRCVIGELRELELVHARFTALMRSDSGAAERVLQSYGDRAFPEFRRLRGDQEPFL